jgi:hypothetical protein
MPPSQGMVLICMAETGLFLFAGKPRCQASLLQTPDRYYLYGYDFLEERIRLSVLVC